MSVTVTFTDVESAILSQLMNNLSDPCDADFAVINKISEKINNQLMKRENKIEKALADYKEQHEIQ